MQLTGDENNSKRTSAHKLNIVNNSCIVVCLKFKLRAWPNDWVFKMQLFKESNATLTWCMICILQGTMVSCFFQVRWTGSKYLTWNFTRILLPKIINVGFRPSYSKRARWTFTEQSVVNCLNCQWHDMCVAGDRRSNDTSRHLLWRQHRLSDSARHGTLHLLILQVRRQLAFYLQPAPFISALSASWISRTSNKCRHCVR